MSPGFDRVPVQVCVYFFRVRGEDYVETLTVQCMHGALF